LRSSVKAAKTVAERSPRQRRGGGVTFGPTVLGACPDGRSLADISSLLLSDC
jgi:hypothetical protein